MLNDSFVGLKYCLNNVSSILMPFFSINRNEYAKTSFDPFPPPPPRSMVHLLRRCVKADGWRCGHAHRRSGRGRTSSANTNRPFRVVMDRLLKMLIGQTCRPCGGGGGGGFGSRPLGGDRIGLLDSVNSFLKRKFGTSFKDSVWMSRNASPSANDVQLQF